MTEKKLRSLQQIFDLDKGLGKKSGDLFSATKLNLPNLHLCVYEDSDALELPIVVVPAENDLENFFADVATYFPERAPISAYFHILDEISYQSLLIQRKSTSKSTIKKYELAAIIGLVFGEALSVLRNVGNQSILPSYTSCKRTLSYCIARAAVLHPHLSTHEIAARWFLIRQLTGMEFSTSGAATVNLASDLIKGNISKQSDPEIGGIFNLLSAYLTKKIKRERLAVHLSSLYPGIAENIPPLYDAFEKRIDAFSAIVKAIRQSSRGQEFDSICVAFFCNMILPGSFSHAGLIDRLLPTMPDSMLWYGLFAGSSDEFSSTSPIGGVGQKLLRDLIAPFDLSARPTCDLSVEEYDVLARLPLRSEMLKPTQAKAVLVSLYPGVEVYVRSVMEDDEVTDRASLSNLLADRDERINHARELLLHAEQILSAQSYTSAGRQQPRSSRKVRSGKI